MLTFYTNPMSRGRMVRWMLEELGEPYETVALNYGPDMNTPEYLALNPMGKVPTVVHDGRVVTEVAAICTYLAEAFPEKGLMAEDRAAFYRWMFFAAGPLEAAVVNNSFGWKPPQRRDEGRLGYGNLDRVVRTLAGHLETHDYVADGRFTAADVYIGGHVGWGLQFGTLPAEPAFRAYAARLQDRPAAQSANALDDALAGAR
ncbi:glutathione S-transferase family protein [Neotabrizicola sp. VNH66]|uniref:glutathione S-transferase family protein n=1 Tax=Neotabrizicola sp. VNH66 TaxID=3400918 RepID=UPI003BFD1C5E